jgi:hypothetical protein
VNDVDMPQPFSIEMFDVLWELVVREQARPAVLRTGSLGRTTGERLAVVDDVTAKLRAAGHLGPLGVADETVALLNTVARPRLAVDVRLFEQVPVDHRHPTGVRKAGARVAVAGAVGAAIVLVQDGVLTWSFPAASLVTEVVALFGAHGAPRRFPGLTARLDQVHVLARRVANDPTLRLLSGPYLRRAHATAIAHDHVAGGTRVSAGLTVNDTEAGRFLVYPDRNSLVIAPGNRTTLERKLRAMIEFS